MILNKLAPFDTKGQRNIGRRSNLVSGELISQKLNEIPLYLKHTHLPSISNNNQHSSAELSGQCEFQNTSSQLQIPLETLLPMFPSLGRQNTLVSCEISRGAYKLTQTPQLLKTSTS